MKDRCRKSARAMLAVAFLMLVFAADSSSATPEYARCIEEPGIGHYKDASCTQKATLASQRLYGLKKGVALPSWTAVAEGAELHDAGGTQLVCSSATASGEYAKASATSTAMARVANVRIQFHGCALPLLGITCHTPGAEAYELSTNVLEGRLAYASKAGHTLLQELRPAPSAPARAFLAFECGNGAVRTELGQGTGRGGDCVYGAAGPVNVPGTSSSYIFRGVSGVQEPGTAEGSTRTCNLETQTNGGGWERAGISADLHVVSEEAIEIRG